tara:strand:- start:1340 stop:1801 length:462 start_codon:yes stop_codon:yes gene_type:complete
LTACFVYRETFDTFDRFQTPAHTNHHDLNYSSSVGTGEKGLVWDGAGGSFGSDASFTSAFRPSTTLDPFQTPTALKNTNTPSTFYTPAAAIELAEAAVASNGGGGGTHAPKDTKGKKKKEEDGKLETLASVAGRLPVRESHDFDELVRDLQRM